MTIEQLGLILAIITAFISLFGTFLGFLQFKQFKVNEIYSEISKIAKIEVKVDTLWSFLMRRALVEGLNQNIGTMNSPLIVKQEIKEKCKLLQSKLREYYLSLNVGLSDSELMLKLEQQFGDDLMKEISIPNKLSNGACLLIALALAKDNNHINI